MNNPVIQTDLGEILIEIKQELRTIGDRLGRLEVGQAELRGDIKNIDERLSGQIKSLDERLSGQIKSLDERLSGQIKANDEKLSGRIEVLDKKLSGQIEASDEKLSGQIEATDGKLSGKIATLDEKVSGHKQVLEKITVQLDKRISNQELINRVIGGSLVVSIIGGLIGFFWMASKF